jgi:hypothetical protein
VNEFLLLIDNNITLEIPTFSPSLQYVMALCYVCLALLPVSASLLVQCTYTAVLLFPGVWFVGVVKHMQLVAARHNLQALIAVNTAWSYLCMM